MHPRFATAFHCAGDVADEFSGIGCRKCERIRLYVKEHTLHDRTVLVGAGCKHCHIQPFYEFFGGAAELYRRLIVFAAFVGRIFVAVHSHKIGCAVAIIYFDFQCGRIDVECDALVGYLLPESRRASGR